MAKLTTLLILISFMQLSAEVYAQAGKLDLKVKNVSILQVFEEIEDNSEYRFFYDNDQVDLSKKVSMDTKQEELASVLTQLFEGTDLTYQVKDWLILVQSKSANVITNIGQQQRTVSGTVTDESGEPLPGVTVIVKGTTQGTVTNADGNYSISNIPEDATLVFSFVGMKTQEISVENQTSINVEMEEETIGIEEVVAIGYGTVRKRDLTGSVSSLSSDELKLTPLRFDASSLIQGYIPGVEVVNNNGAPGATSAIRIRGRNSMLGSSNPLFVVDGMPGLYTGSPNDIESIEVLKDASSTAIYGSRGANGVIIITTKRGKEGKPLLNVDAYHGIQQIRKKYDLLNAQEYAEFANERAANLGLAPYYPDLNDLPGNTDWQDEVYQNGSVQNLNISAKGGTDKNRYAISGNLTKEEGLVKSTYNTLGSFKLNTDNRLSDWFEISTSIAAEHYNRNSVTQSWDNSVIYKTVNTPPVAPVFDDEGQYFFIGTLPSADPLWANPVESIDATTRERVGNRITGNTIMKLNLVKGLDYSLRLGLDYYNTRLDLYNRMTTTDYNAASIDEDDSYYYVVENILTYKKNFNDKHDLNITAGYTWEQNTDLGISASGNYFLNDILLTNAVQTASVLNTPTTGKSQSKIISWIGRANYIFNDKYLLTITTRADGSSKLGKNNKWGFFPSAAVAWRVSDENFFDNISFISHLKLRASYGLTGNQGVGNYLSLSRLGLLPVSLGVNEDRYVSFVPTQMENPELRWEQTAQLDVGFDLGLLSQKVNITFDYYDKTTTDLLALVPLPMSSGYSSITKNFGSMRNKGIELGINTHLVHSGQWQLDIGANFSLNRNEVLKVAAEGGEFFASTTPVPINTVTHLIKEGEPFSAFYGYLIDGLWEEDQPTGSIQPTAKAGDQRYKDTNGDGLLTDNDRVILGNAYPDFIYGLNSNLSYRRLSLNILLQGVQGGKRLLFHKYILADNFSRMGNQMEETKDHWSLDNPDPNAEYPRLSNIVPRFSDRYIDDASYLRLKTVSLAYTIPTERLGFMNELIIYAAGQNLVTITKYSGYDPELDTDVTLKPGIDGATYPLPKTYTLGIKINF